MDEKSRETCRFGQEGLCALASCPCPTYRQIDNGSDDVNLSEWSDQQVGRILDGVVLRVPVEYVRKHALPQEDMALKSAWQMGDDKRGLWLIVPPDKYGRVYPVFNVPVEEFFTWEVVGDHWEVALEPS